MFHSKTTSNPREIKNTGNNSFKAGQTDSQVDASQRKFSKPELAYELAMDGQTDSQVHASHKFHAYTVDLRWVAKR